MKRLAALALVLCSGCYHFAFEQAPPATTAAKANEPPPRTVRYKRHVPTYLNGFVGTGRVYAYEMCEKPVRTELKVSASDVLVSMATLLVYTPHTLYVTCER